MANALNRFLKKRNVSATEVQEAGLLQTLYGKAMSLTYLWVVLLKEDAGISIENIERLDAHYNLTKEEKTDLLTMVKRRGRKSPSTMEDLEEKRRDRKIRSSISDHESTMSKCKMARDLIVQLRKKRDDFKLLLCIDWKRHGETNSLSPEKSIQTMLEVFIENRVEAAKVQSELLRILWKIEGIIKIGLESEMEVFGKIPSSFMMFESDDFFERTRFVAEQGKKKIYSLVTNDVDKLNQDFLGWINKEAKRGNGLVDTTKYSPDKDFLSIGPWFEAISFPDLSYTEVSIPFVPVRAEMLSFFGIEEVLTIVEESEKAKITDLTAIKALQE